MTDTNEIGIARKARDAMAELEQLREENARLVTQLDHLRAGSRSIDIAPRGKRCRTCIAVYVDNRKRRVTCQECGHTLDAIDVLHEYATKERQFWDRNERVKQEHAKLSAAVESMKADLAAVGRQRARVLCPRECGAMVVRDQCVTGGVVAHACYKRRAQAGKVPRDEERRWRAVTDEGPTNWCDQISAMKYATDHGGHVEEYKGAIGDKAERAAERVAAYAKQQKVKVPRE